MSTELKAMLYLMFYQVVWLFVYSGGELLYAKDKIAAKEIAKRLGLVLLGIAESALIIFLCWLFG